MITSRLVGVSEEDTVEVDSAARQQDDGGDRLGEHGAMAVPDRIHECTAPHPVGLAREGGMHGDGLERVGVIRSARAGIDKVPRRDPVESEVFDVAVQRAQFGG
jgi:hypothetical protein